MSEITSSILLKGSSVGKIGYLTGDTMKPDVRDPAYTIWQNWLSHRKHNET
jgi:hypothetical protein